MNIEQLNHSLTPLDLSHVNDEIVEIINLEDEHEKFIRLKEVIIKRDEIITNYLATLPPSVKASFATKELAINDQLLDLTIELHKNVKQEVVDFVRGRAAVEKYK